MSSENRYGGLLTKAETGQQRLSKVSVSEETQIQTTVKQSGIF